ncbi:uncharacterized protein BKA55DRAFT_553608 [Fusarium redolens]|uniref:Uncharacterized protein n=1 Tax=Fusarium redolens TaxID=48865 RepID=A0A9P9KQY1_FUSRE|nr:uncharacterized protein BKA55DRAFT_553608 [Fusarium redolens]KAH7266893.1 hypothetical protein BKA55DRAFT_553608 [Fusarium redolens]
MSMYHHHKFHSWIFTTQSTHYHGFSTGNGQNSHKHHLCTLRYLSNTLAPVAMPWKIIPAPLSLVTDGGTSMCLSDAFCSGCLACLATA